jgi:hypothetical protein
MQKTARVAAAPITTVEYSAFQQAYDFYNAELFEEKLPNVLVTLPRHTRSMGYFGADRFVGRQRDGSAHELALNPRYFGDTESEILSTLVHEMVHVWQQEYGKPGRGRYHNKEWAVQMFAIGLHPSSTGKKGGAPTGQRVSHYIIENGPFAKATAKLLKTGFTLNWQATSPLTRRQRREQDAKAASKTKFTCPNCLLNAWAKPDAALLCGACYEESRDVVLLEPVPPA